MRGNTPQDISAHSASGGAMNLGQIMMVALALMLLGGLVLNANSSVYQSTDTMYTSEFGVTAISLATSVVEEASGKMFDNAIAGTNAAAVYDSSLFTSPGALGPEAGESYRGPNDFNDIDDYNGLFIVYKSNVAADTISTPGSNREIIVPGIRSKYFVRCKVCYVQPPNLDVSYTAKQTWHKKITVTVTSPSTRDSLVYPAIMSYWN
jgi:hypothetical protein